ncbi:MAG: hypothetical protein R3B93_00710 [Bacteroidia bacterium]
MEVFKKLTYLGLKRQIRRPYLQLSQDDAWNQQDFTFVFLIALILLVIKLTNVGTHSFIILFS